MTFYLIYDHRGWYRKTIYAKSAAAALQRAKEMGIFAPIIGQHDPLYIRNIPKYLF